MEKLKERVCKHIDELKIRIFAIAQKIHENPEVGFEEKFAVSLLKDELKDFGFSLSGPVANLDTAFVAIHKDKADGPTISLLAEYDALPEIGHACGHNLIAAASFGAAAALAQMKEELPGTLKLLGTTAEEGGSGKATMIEGGCFEDVDVAMMFHPDKLNVCGDTSLAVKDVTYQFKGREAHASSCPEQGINALDSVIATFNSINALRQHTKDEARIHGIITHGGTRPNIVPGFAECQFYVRAKDDDYLEELLEKVHNCARGGALSSGAELTIKYGHACKTLQEDEKLNEYWRENMKALGIEEQQRPTQEMGSTDMGDVSHVTRAIHPYLSIVPKGAEVDFHTVELAQAAGTKLAFETALNAAKLLAMTALDVWTKE